MCTKAEGGLRADGGSEDRQGGQEKVTMEACKQSMAAANKMSL